MFAEFVEVFAELVPAPATVFVPVCDGEGDREGAWYCFDIRIMSLAFLASLAFFWCSSLDVEFSVFRSRLYRFDAAAVGVLPAFGSPALFGKAGGNTPDPDEPPAVGGSDEFALVPLELDRDRRVRTEGSAGFASVDIVRGRDRRKLNEIDVSSSPPLVLLLLDLSPFLLLSVACPVPDESSSSPRL